MFLYILLALAVAVAIGDGLWKLVTRKGPAVFITSILALLIALGIDLVVNAGGQRGMYATGAVAIGGGILIAIAAVTQGFVSLGKSKAPRALLWFAATAVIYVLQLIPFTGIFLMFLAAPFWSVLTVNAGFAHLAAEACLGKVHKAWLILPIAWFAGYEIAALQSHRMAWNLDRQFRDLNSHQNLNFDQNEKEIVFLPTSEVLSGAPQTLVARYQLNAAYERNPNFPNYSHLVYRENVRTPEDPTKGILLTSGSYKDFSGHLLPYRKYTITMLDRSTRTSTLLAGNAAPLSWLPLPILGCTLISGAPSWNCAFQFWRTNVGIAGSETHGGAVIEVVATALNLKARHLQTKRK